MPNINQMSKEDIMRLEGFDERRAGAIIATRDRKGGFTNLDELREVEGINDEQLDMLRKADVTAG